MKLPIAIIAAGLALSACAPINQTSAPAPQVSYSQDFCASFAAIAAVTTQGRLDGRTKATMAQNAVAIIVSEDWPLNGPMAANAVNLGWAAAARGLSPDEVLYASHQLCLQDGWAYQ